MKAWKTVASEGGMRPAGAQKAELTPVNEHFEHRRVASRLLRKV